MTDPMTEREDDTYMSAYAHGIMAARIVVAEALSDGKSLQWVANELADTKADAILSGRPTLDWPEREIDPEVVGMTIAELSRNPRTTNPPASEESK